jgi:hypothetical protein
LSEFHYATIRKSRVRDPMRWMIFFYKLPNPSSRTGPCGLLSL